MKFQFPLGYIETIETSFLIEIAYLDNSSQRLLLIELDQLRYLLRHLHGYFHDIRILLNRHLDGLRVHQEHENDRGNVVRCGLISAYSCLRYNQEKSLDVSHVIILTLTAIHGGGGRNNHVTSRGEPASVKDRIRRHRRKNQTDSMYLLFASLFTKLYRY